MNKNEEQIIMNVTGLTKSQLFLSPKFSESQNTKIKKDIKRLEGGEPLEYIVNKAEFYGFDFYVDNRVLIPRNDTEVMVDEVVRMKLQKEITMIDIGTGSGCLSISIVKNLELNNCYAVDISKEVLEVVKINVEKHNLQERIKLLKSDLLNTFLEKKELKLNKNIIITANLPYIKDVDYENMDKSVIEYEPKLALYGGKVTGFEIYEKLINQCLELKNIYKLESFTIFIEIGFDQYEYSKGYLKNLGLEFEYFKDNGDIERCIKIEF